jgi:hypothetical protein
MLAAALMPTVKLLVVVATPSGTLMTALVPSWIALATSVTFARPGRLCWIKDSSVWVEVMTGSPTGLA